MARNINLRGIIPADYNYREYRAGDTAGEAQGLNGKYQFVQYSDGQNNIRGIEGMVAYYTMNATAGGNRNRHEVTCDYGGNTTSKYVAGIICGRNSLTFPDGGGIVADGDGVWIQKTGPSINDLWTGGNVSQLDMLGPSGLATAKGLTLGQETTANATNAVTNQGVIGKFTDDVDVSLDATRAALVLTNGHARVNSIVQILAGTVLDTNARMTIGAVPADGSVTFDIRNAGTGNQTGTITYQYALLTEMHKLFGHALQDDETTEGLALFSAGYTGTPFTIGETITWAGGATPTAVVRRIYQSISAGVTTQWGIYFDTLSDPDAQGAITGATSGGTTTPTSNGTETAFFRLRAQNVQLSLAA